MVKNHLISHSNNLTVIGMPGLELGHRRHGDFLSCGSKQLSDSCSKNSRYLEILFPGNLMFLPLLSCYSKKNLYQKLIMTTTYTLQIRKVYIVERITMTEFKILFFT
jgi:hypothetical protein